jgi:hypothetical protein
MTVLTEKVIYGHNLTMLITIFQKMENNLKKKHR